MDNVRGDLTEEVEVTGGGRGEL